MLTYLKLTLNPLKNYVFTTLCHLIKGRVLKHKIWFKANHFQINR